jgi:hypothetical protein
VVEASHPGFDSLTTKLGRDINLISDRAGNLVDSYSTRTLGDFLTTTLKFFKVKSIYFIVIAIE